MSGSVSMVDGHIDPDTNKLTDKEIIKALECCGTATCISNSCPYEKIHDIPTCTTKLTRDALDLINRQQAEIDELKHEREVLIEDIHHSADQTNEQMEEIEKLNVELVGMRDACKSYKMHYDNAQAELERLTINMNAFGLGMKREKERADTIRAEAIKEFAEKLKEDLGIWSFDFTYYADRAEARGYIDNLVKEIVGEDK